MDDSAQHESMRAAQLLVRGMLAEGLLRIRHILCFAEANMMSRQFGIPDFAGDVRSPMLYRRVQHSWVMKMDRCMYHYL